MSDLGNKRVSEVGQWRPPEPMVVWVDLDAGNGILGWINGQRRQRGLLEVSISFCSLFSDMSDLEDPLIPGEQPDMALNTALSKVTIASRILSILSAVFAICSATAQQLVSGDKPVFWSNVIILVCTSILLIANLTLFWKQATIRGAVFDWPKKGAWWPVTRGTYPKTAYLGTPYEFLGVAFGICQLTTTTGTLVLHHWKMGPIRFSLIPLAIAAIGVVRGFYPGAFELVFEVVMRCRGEIHRFTGHASGMSIDGDCNSHPEEMEGEQNDDGMEGQNDDGMEGQNDDIQNP